MDTLVLEGVYEDGKIELEAQPRDVQRARVRVTFLPEAVEEAATAEAARQRALERMRAGINFGGEKFNREEIYEDRTSDLDSRGARRR